MVITHKLAMDLEKNASNQRIEMPQGDVSTRRVRFALTTDGRPWEIPEGAAVLVCYRKQDGTGGAYDTLPDGTQAWFAEGNKLTITLAPQILTVTGTVVLQVRMLLKERVLHTFPVEIFVSGVKMNDANRIDGSEDYFYVTHVLPGPVCAQAGQFLAVSAVDAQGRVVRVQAVDVAEGKPGANGIGISEIEIMEV